MGTSLGARRQPIANDVMVMASRSGAEKVARLLPLDQSYGRSARTPDTAAGTCRRLGGITGLRLATPAARATN